MGKIEEKAWTAQAAASCCPTLNKDLDPLEFQKIYGNSWQAEVPDRQHEFRCLEPNFPQAIDYKRQQSGRCPAMYQERISIEDANFSQIERNLHIARYKFAASLDLGNRVLDCACGTGYGSRILVSTGNRTVIGADISALSIEEAMKGQNSPELSFVQADAEKAEQLPGPFTGIVSFETIEHVPRPDLLLANFFSVLKPGGLFVISTPNGSITSPVGFLSPANRYHLWEDSVSRFRARLEAAGFKVRASYGQAYLSQPMRTLYWAARVRGQLMTASRLAAVERYFLKLESKLVRRFQSSVVDSEKDAWPDDSHPTPHYVYQVHVCQKPE